MEMGFERVFALEGGFREWVRAGYPVQSKESSTPGCIPCHRSVTPEVVAQWETSRHAAKVNNVSCSVCHGREHATADDTAKARIPGAKTCRTCHEQQSADFAGGKHARAEQAIRRGRPLHWPSLAADGNRTKCLRCHRIGLKGNPKRAPSGTPETAGASCESCHSSHAFSTKEAASPRTCLPCHRPQWEAYNSSPHGERYELRRQGLLIRETRAPTCQTCHMSGGEHGVRTASGFLGLEWPLSSEPTEWNRARKDILRALDYLDAQGKPTERLQKMREIGFVSAEELARQKERIGMKKTCFDCHQASFVKRQWEDAERVLRRADILMAKALRAASSSRESGSGETSDPQRASNLPDLAEAHQSKHHTIQLLGLMFREHRMRAIRGAYHFSLEKAFHRGLDEMRRDLVEIRAFESRE